MTRAYAIVRLLQLGPMDVTSIVAVGGAGWAFKETNALVQRLRRDGLLTFARDASYRLNAPIEDILRRLRAGEQRDRAPARVAPIQPRLYDVRSAGDLLRAPHAQPVGGAPQRVDVLAPAALAAVRAQRGGAARRRQPLMVRMGSLGQ